MKLRLVALLILNVVSVNAIGQVSVSMVQLLSDGETFNGASVEVFGYMTSVGGAALYLTRDHVGDTPSSVGLKVTDEMAENFKKCRSKYVRIVGDLVFEDGAPYLENIRSIFDSENIVYCHRE